MGGAGRQVATGPSSAAQAPWDASHAPVRAVRWDGNCPTVLACGPHPMLHRCAELAAASGAPCQVALEEPMACGFGVCLGCAIRVHAPHPDAPAYALVCRDGPVFPADQACCGKEKTNQMDFVMPEVCQPKRVIAILR